jgi:hypothetical protein
MPEIDLNRQYTTREQIYEGLQECIPYLKRRECTPRVMSESGVDFLLDRLILIQQGEEQMELARQFNEVFGGDYGQS